MENTKAPPGNDRWANWANHPQNIKQPAASVATKVVRSTFLNSGAKSAAKPTPEPLRRLLHSARPFDSPHAWESKAGLHPPATNGQTLAEHPCTTTGKTPRPTHHTDRCGVQTSSSVEKNTKRYPDRSVHNLTGPSKP